jgi:1-acyl-sn-glycerol-3-phosphate acyltransferase
MGTLEVNALPGLIASRTPMTFVVKDSLLRLPFFGQVLRRLNAIPVQRKNPGEDLKQVFSEGERLLSEGVSIILFPESTRQDVFSSRRFNSLAVKLAIRAGVPVIPVALRTDFWGVGRLIKEFGPIFPERRVHITFGEPLFPSGRGRTEHQQVLDFIASHLLEWGAAVEKPED